jgi:hypothetical protein
VNAYSTSDNPCGQLYLPGLQSLPQILGRRAHHEAAEEHCEQHHHDEAVQAAAGTARADLAQHDVGHEHAPAEAREAVVRRIGRTIATSRSRLAEQCATRYTEPRLGAFRGGAGGMHRGAVYGKLGDGEHDDPDHEQGSGRGEKRPPLPLSAHHHPKGAQQRHRNDQHRNDFDEVGQRRRVLEGMGTVRVEGTAAVAGHQLDGLPGGDRAATDSGKRMRTTLRTTSTQKLPISSD